MGSKPSLLTYSTSVWKTVLSGFYIFVVTVKKLITMIIAEMVRIRLIILLLHIYKNVNITGSGDESA